MARRLKKLMQDNKDKKILAVMGAGHEKEIIDMIKSGNISYSIQLGYS